MLVTKRYCVEYEDGAINCFRDGGFWYSNTGLIIKWVLLAVFFFIFFGWFLGGYIHARARMKKGKPLMRYHRFLVGGPASQHYGPQNHFAYYSQQQQPYRPRQDGAWTEPPPTYQNNDAPPQYFAPQAAKVNANANQDVEMPVYGGQPSGATGASAGDEQAQLPPRPQTAKTRIAGVLSRFRK